MIECDKVKLPITHFYYYFKVSNVLFKTIIILYIRRSSSNLQPTVYHIIYHFKYFRDTCSFIFYGIALI